MPGPTQGERAVPKLDVIQCPNKDKEVGVLGARYPTNNLLQVLTGGEVCGGMST